MRFTTTTRLATAAWAGLIAAAVRADAVKPAGTTTTAEDVQKSLADGDYTAAVTGASKLLAATGSAAPAAPEKAKLYAMKGDAELHLKQYSSAGDAYARAAKLSTDAKATATDAATALLVKRSRGGAYAPKQPAADGTKPSPVDITADDRRTALGYLFADELAADAAKLKAAKAAKSVPQLLAGVNLAVGLRQIEEAATDVDAKSAPEVRAISDAARAVVQAGLDQLKGQLGSIKEASESRGGGEENGGTGGGGGGGSPAGPSRGRRSGLTAQAVSGLKSIMSTCQQQIVPAADTFAKATADVSSGGSSPAAAATATDDPAGGGTAAVAAPAGTGEGGSLSAAWQAISTDATQTATQAQELITNSTAGRSRRGR